MGRQRTIGQKFQSIPGVNNLKVIYYIYGDNFVITPAPNSKSYVVNRARKAQGARDANLRANFEIK